MCRANAATAVILVLLSLGCSSAPTPDGYLEHPDDVAGSPYGGWIQILPEQEHASDTVGELIAVDNDSLYVLTIIGLHRVAVDDVRDAKLYWFAPDSELMGLWMAMGTLSTISHGYFLSLTAPAWLLIGGASVHANEQGGRIRYPSAHSLRELSMYARFPQGMPSNLDRERLAYKPLGNADQMVHER